MHLKGIGPHGFSVAASVYNTLFFLAFILVCVPVFSADYILIGVPAGYGIMNKYEQPIGEEVLSGWPKGVPFKIVHKNMTLGDGISQAMQCSWHGVTYYLPLNDKKRVLPVPGAQKSHIFIKHVRIVGDTVHIIRNKAVRFAPQARRTGKTVKMDKGDQVFRIFKKNGRYYVYRKGKNKQYGWSRMTPASGWRKSLTKKTLSQRGLDKETIKRMSEIIIQVNREYRQFYGVFNRYTRSNQPVPQWERDVGGKTSYILQPEDAALDLKRSHRVLVEQLNDLLFGSGYRAEQKGAWLKVSRIAGAGP